MEAYKGRMRAVRWALSGGIPSAAAAVYLWSLASVALLIAWLILIAVFVTVVGHRIAKRLRFRWVHLEPLHIQQVLVARSGSLVGNEIVSRQHVDHLIGKRNS